MTDDKMGGVRGNPEVTGKPSASDIANKKKTPPVICALDKSLALRKLCDKDQVDAKTIPVVLGILNDLGALAYTRNLADHYRSSALAELEFTGFRNAVQ